VLEVPDFESMRGFTDWLRSDEVQRALKADPDVLLRLFEHPRARRWLSVLVKDLQRSAAESGRDLPPEEAIRILATPPKGDATGEDAHLLTKDMSGSASPEFVGDAETIPAFFGRYRIVEKLAEGGFGTVYLATDPKLDDRLVALKLLKLETVEEVEHFRREAALAAKLRHPSIVSIHEFGVFNERPYYTMDFIEGRTLRDLLNERGRLPVRETFRIAAAVADALEHSHAHGVVHRDVKPENIFLDEEGHVYVGDFGLARQAEPRRRDRTPGGGARTRDTWVAPDTLTETAKTPAETDATGGVLPSRVAGTPYYMSPEQVEANVLDGRSDVWSLGVVVYECLTGVMPFDAPDHRRLFKSILSHRPPPPHVVTARKRRRSSGAATRAAERPVDRDAGTIVMKCLEKAKERRYASAAEMKADIERYLRGEPISARPLGPMERLWRRLRRNKAASIGLGGAAAALVVAALVLWRQSVRRTEELHRRRTEAARFLTEAREEFDKRNYEKALELAGRSLTLRPGGAEAERLKRECEKRLETKKRKEAARRKAEALLAQAALAGSLSERLALLDRAVDADPSCLSAQMEKGRLLKDAYRYEEAIKTYERAIETAKTNGDAASEAVANYRIGVILWEQEKQPDAEKYMAEVKRLMPGVDNDMTRLVEAVAAFKKKDLPEVVKWCTKALEANPNSSVAYRMRGFAYLHLGDYRAAIEDFNRATAIRPSYVEAYTFRGMAKTQSGDCEGAIADFDRVIRMAPQHVYAHSNRAVVKYKMGDYRGAIDDFTTVLRLRPDDAHAYKGRALAKRAINDLKGALADYDESIKLKPAVDTYNNRSIIKKMLGDLKGAAADISEAIKLAPNLPEPYVSRGNIKADAGDLDGAIADYLKAARLRPEMWQVWANLSLAYARKRQRKKCIDALAKTLRLNPRSKSWARKSRSFDWLRGDAELERLLGGK